MLTKVQASPVHINLGQLRSLPHFPTDWKLVQMTKPWSSDLSTITITQSWVKFLPFGKTALYTTKSPLNSLSLLSSDPKTAIDEADKWFLVNKGSLLEVGSMYLTTVRFRMPLGYTWSPSHIIMGRLSPFRHFCESPKIVQMRKHFRVVFVQQGSVLVAWPNFLDP